jgi:NADH-quinone oxidoreductase subunit E
VWKETFEDLTPQSLEKLIDEWSQGAKPKTGPQIDRQFSMAEGGASSLTDPALYASRRTYARVEAPPPPPAVPAATTAPAVAAPVAPVAAAPVAPTPVVAPPVVPATTTLPPPQKFVDIVAERVKKVKVTKKRDDDAPAPSKSSPKSSAKTSGEPEKLAKPRDGKGDDLELIWGVGPGLARTLNKMGFWHFDQIANWTAAELKWVDTNLKGFKGRASRDEWVPQAKKLAKGWRPDSDIGENPNAKPIKKSGKK